MSNLFVSLQEEEIGTQRETPETCTHRGKDRVKTKREGGRRKAKERPLKKTNQLIL